MKVFKFIDKNKLMSKSLEFGSTTGFFDIIKRTDRFGRAKLQSKKVAEYIGEILDRDEHRFLTCNQKMNKLHLRLDCCSDWMRFAHYIDHEETRLTAANFCNYPLLCQSCAVRRGALLVQKYDVTINQILSDNPKLKPYMLTLTVANGENLLERYEHLKKCFKLIQNKRSKYACNPDRYAFTEFSKIDGAVFSYEIPKTKDGLMWNPHIHMLILCEEKPDMGFVRFDKKGNYLPEKSFGLRNEWYKITGDSFMLDLQDQRQSDVIDMCMEVMKYAVKFSDQDAADTWNLFRTLRGKQLFGSFGSLRGVKIPKNLLDEKLTGPYYEYTMKYFGGGIYSVYSFDDCTCDYETPGT